MITIDNVGKMYKKKAALTNITLRVEGIYALIGSNGAGKSTLMKILAGLIKAGTGSISLDNENLMKRRYVKHENHIGFLPQDFNIYPKVSVQDSLEHLAILKGHHKKVERRGLISTILRKVNLLDAAQMRMEHLSGGMKKRVGIAQILLGNPKILILDEPTAGLDIEERIRFRNLIRKLSDTYTIIISSHVVEDIEFLCTKIGILKHGHVMFEGTPEELKKHAEKKVWDYRIQSDGLESMLETKDVVQVMEDQNGLIVRIYDPIEKGPIYTKPRLVDGYLSVLRQSDQT